MEPVAGATDKILKAASDQLRSEGVAALTVGAVAKAAGVSAALVHYHFSTKQRLLVATATRLCADRLAARSRLFAEAGLGALDTAWVALERAVADGEARAWLDLLSLARDDDAVHAAMSSALAAEADRYAERLPALVRSLGAVTAAAPEELAQLTLAVLDGAAAALLAGRPSASVRSAFDAFWLVLIAAGQTARR